MSEHDPSRRQPALARTLAIFWLLHAGSVMAANYENDEPGERKRAFAAGDLLQVGIPLAGFGMTYLLERRGGAAGPPSSWRADDALDPLKLAGSPRHNFLAAGLRMELMTQSLKFAVNEQRPDGGAHSFPSGHTATAFMGAEFIRAEYGWAWGVPAYLAAGYVGWTRVASQNHWTHDVLAGAAIGITANHDVAEFPLASGVLTIQPMVLFAPPVRRLAPGEAADATGAGAGVLLKYDFGTR